MIIDNLFTLQENTEHEPGSAYDRGGADAWYHRQPRPHKIVDGQEVPLTDPAEIAQYHQGFKDEDIYSRHAGKQYDVKEQGVEEGFKDVVAGGALALAAMGAGAQSMPNINVQQVELANKYYNGLVQRAKEDGRQLDTRTLNFLRAKAQDLAAQKLQQENPQAQKEFPDQGREQRRARDADQFESTSAGVAEGVNEKQIRRDLDSGMSHDAVIGKHANKKLSNTNQIRKVIQQHSWDQRMKKKEGVAEGSEHTPQVGNDVIIRKRGGMPGVIVADNNDGTYTVRDENEQDHHVTADQLIITSYSTTVPAHVGTWEEGVAEATVAHSPRLHFKPGELEKWEKAVVNAWRGRVSINQLWEGGYEARLQNAYLVGVFAEGEGGWLETPQKYKRDMAEGSDTDNFTIDDIHELEKIKDLPTLKSMAKQLIKGKPVRRMKPEKITWFYNHIDELNSPLAVIKMMYHLLLAGEGHRVIGGRHSMTANSYQQRFGEQKKDLDEGDENIVAVIDGVESDRNYNDRAHAHNSLAKLVSYRKAKVAELYVNGKKVEHFELGKKYLDFEPKSLDSEMTENIHNVAFIGKFTKDGRNYSLWSKGNYWYELTTSTQDREGGFKHVAEWHDKSLEDIKTLLQQRGFEQKKDLDEGKWFRTTYGWAGGEKPGGGKYPHPELVAQRRRAKAAAKKKAVDAARYGTGDTEVAPDQAVAKIVKTDPSVSEAGPFSYGAKKPRLGSVADLAAKKRKEQERGKLPIEPNDQQVGVAKIVKTDPSVSEARPTRHSMPWSVWNSKSAQDQEFLLKQHPNLVITDKPKPVKPQREKINYGEIANKIEQVVGDTFPDGDPLDWLIPYMRRRWGMEYNAMQHLDRAARKILGARNYYDYLETIWDQVADDELVANVRHENNPWRVSEGHDEVRYVLSLNGKDAAHYASEREARDQAQQVLQRHPDTKIEIRQVRPGIIENTRDQHMKENLHKWFKEKWVRFGPDGKIRGDCARGSDTEGKPKCLPQSKAHALGKKGRASAASRKRREDPNPTRRGAARNVATQKEDIAEQKCPHCGGIMVDDPVLAEKKDACYHKVRSRYKVWPSAYASGALVQCRKKGAANWGKKSR